MRICISYDCLYPWTVGGAERTYRALAERLAAEGHNVTYLTRLQWDTDQPPDIPGVDVRAVSPREPLYGPDGRRRITEAIRFGAGVFVELLLHGRRYDVVHTASFPFFSVLAAAAARPFGGFEIVIDWHEVWSRDYWREYLGSPAGAVGYLIQRLCVRIPHRPFCFSRLHSERLQSEGIKAPPTILEGKFVATSEPTKSEDTTNNVVFAGRHIREKGPTAAVRAIAIARERGLDVTGTIFGEGPEHQQVIQEIANCGLEGTVEAPGFVDADVVENAIAEALCLLHPSSREGYGLVVLEAAALGTPVILAYAPDNAATELVDEGVNGIVAPSTAPRHLADALLEVADRGEELRKSTREWYEHNAGRLSLDASIDLILANYADAPSARS